MPDNPPVDMTDSLMQNRRFWFMLLLVAGLGGGISNTGLTAVLRPADTDLRDRILRMESAVNTLADDIRDLKTDAKTSTEHLRIIEQDMAAIRAIVNRNPNTP